MKKKLFDGLIARFLTKMCVFNSDVRELTHHEKQTIAWINSGPWKRCASLRTWH